MGVAVNPAGGDPPDRRLHHDGAGLRADRGGPFQGPADPRPQFRHVRDARAFPGCRRSRPSSSIRPRSPSPGGGEPPIITMGAVIANAIFDATGARLLPAAHDAGADQSGALIGRAGRAGGGGPESAGPAGATGGPARVFLNQFSAVPNFVRTTTPQPRMLTTAEKRNPMKGMNPMKLTTSSPRKRRRPAARRHVPVEATGPGFRRRSRTARPVRRP